VFKRYLKLSQQFKGMKWACTIVGRASWKSCKFAPQNAAAPIVHTRTCPSPPSTPPPLASVGCCVASMQLMSALLIKLCWCCRLKLCDRGSSRVAELSMFPPSVCVCVCVCMHACTQMHSLGAKAHAASCFQSHITTGQTVTCSGSKINTPVLRQ
jgi:hypothetical protein